MVTGTGEANAAIFRRIIEEGFNRGDLAAMDALAFRGGRSSLTLTRSADGAGVENECCLQWRSGTPAQRRSRRVKLLGCGGFRIAGRNERCRGSGQADACSP